MAIATPSSETWLLYPGACASVAAGTWSPRTNPVADSLNSYPAHFAAPYTAEDHTSESRLWDVVSDLTPASQRPPILDGTRSLWCGRYDPNWVYPVGYRNLTYQILYLDTGSHAGSYSLSFLLNVSVEKYYDYLYLVGGGSNASDPVGNSRQVLDNVIGMGSSGGSELLVTWTGSVRQGASVDGSAADGSFVEGSGDQSPLTVSMSVTGIAPDHRALYFVLKSDCLFSTEDGLWPFGWGVVLDRIEASDRGLLYDDQAAVGGIDAYQGMVIQGTPSQPTISSRTQPGRGSFWQLEPGSSLPTADLCSPQKQSGADLIFLGADPVTYLTTPGLFSSLVSCPLPVPAGTASLTAYWDLYRDLPGGTGFIHYAQYRSFEGGAWTPWEVVIGSSGFGVAERAWITRQGGALPAAVGADSVQVRFTIRCIPQLSADHINCQPVTYGVLVDNLYLAGRTGVSAPEITLDPAYVPQSTFVDGTMTGTHCSAPPCWPGVRGSELPGTVGIHDNVNAPSGDSALVFMRSPVRDMGMGINWRVGYSSLDDTTPTFVRDGAGDGFHPEHDVPRWIYRLHDPVTHTWSPFDSSEIAASVVAVAGPDTVVFGDAFRFDWPPRDKLEVNAALPGGFTIAGKSRYEDLAFLPRGTRLQYYLKAVDIAGGISYRFATDPPPLETEDLPLLPGSAIRAPDIMEFGILPGSYPPGSAGSQLQGMTGTPVLNLDGAYTRWAYGFDAMTEALRALGVRADRYRALEVNLRGANLGGHELPGDRVAFPRNYFPNVTEYGIKDSLAAWYRILLDSGSEEQGTIKEQDARLLSEWWSASTGTDGGDRCLFASGDHWIQSLTQPLPGESGVERAHLAQDVFGVSSASSQWSGAVTNPYPTIDDRFAGGGPGLAAPGTFTYPVDGGCPGPNRFDGLFKTTGASNAAAYPGAVSQVAAVANATELDPTGDRDRGKALAYAFSIEAIRKAGIPPSASNYVRSGAENRMRVLYKFLTSCRGMRTGGGTATCWPCPAPIAMTGNWNVLSEFQTETYGSLYRIQDPARITAIPEEIAGAAPSVNRLEQNRPNPFNPTTVIHYEVSQRGRVVIRIFDVGGRRVRTLVDHVVDAGRHTVPWDGKVQGGFPASSGVYFLRIEFPDGTTSSRKMAILR